MPFAQSRSAYIEASASGASHIGLSVLVYDALAGDIRKAGEAVQEGDVAGRCTHSNHAFALLAHLENWTEYLDDAALRQSLVSFYHLVRTQLMANQTAQEPSALEALAKLITDTRVAWQAKERSSVEANKAEATLAKPAFGSTDSGETSERGSWSA